MEKKRVAYSSMVVYLNADKTAMQIVRPKMDGANRFEGDWGKLAHAVGGNNGYHSFDLI
tara:strand:- start:179 stop:355 length:177 start_codon:yes stop_codon:yes gene_type:complete